MDQEKFRWVRKEILVQFIFFLAILRSTMLFGFRGVFCPSNWLTITAPCTWFDVNFEMIFWAAAVLLLVLELGWERGWKGLLRACRANWLVLGFVALAGLSLIWSIQLYISFYKFVVLLLSTIVAIYIGYIFDLEKLVKSMSWFYLLISFLSFLVVFINPDYGIMQYYFYNNAWNGVFMHRNFLGCFMALGMVLFLVNLLSYKNKHRGYIYLNLIMLVITLVLLVKSQSATGIISALVTVAVAVFLYAWIRWGQNLKLWHYVGFLATALIAFILVMAHLNYFLGFLGRNASLTGRVPMWQYLFQNVINQRPWLGYGYGAIWHFEGFIIELAHKTGWGIAVTLGDNGFIDILLHLGLVGLSILIILIALGFVRGIRYFLQKRTMTAAFPLLVLVFGVVANISLSLILEVETLVWIIAVAALVSIRGKTSSKLTTLTDKGQE